ncbi:MAG: restriction endonuclease [Phycisphaerales bacterium]
MNFDHLSDSDFEELTYDLLDALGFVNLSWRRGSGLGGACADQGRDIVAQWLQTEPDGSQNLKTWFVQCKHYVRGVPPEKLDGALAWSIAERPDVLLFAVSNFLSNPAKTHLESYQRNNRPAFGLRLWERKNFERLLSSYPTLIRKYQLDAGDPAGTVHAAHLEYVLRPTLNTLDYFLRLLDKMDTSMRDEVFSFAFAALISPRLREPRHSRETIAELMLDPIDYPAFHAKCRELVKQGVAEHFLVQAVVSDALSWTWRFSDAAQVDARIARCREAIIYFTDKLETETGEDNIDDISGCIATAKSAVESAPERQRTWKGYYDALCGILLPALALEEPTRHLTPHDS